MTGEEIGGDKGRRSGEGTREGGVGRGKRRRGEEWGGDKGVRGFKEWTLGKEEWGVKRGVWRGQGKEERGVKRGQGKEG